MDSTGFSKEWDEIVKGAKDFAINVQNTLRKGSEIFEEIVEEALNFVINEYNYCKAQICELITILTCVWTHGERLRVWSNVREGADPDFMGLYFSIPASV